MLGLENCLRIYTCDQPTSKSLEQYFTGVIKHTHKSPIHIKKQGRDPQLHEVKLNFSSRV